MDPSGDIAALPAAHPTGHTSVSLATATAVPAPAQVTVLAEAINRARTVTLFCGAGVRDAHAEVMQLAATVNAPIGHSLRGKEWIQYDNPYDVGMSGLLGYGAAFEAMHEAELLVLLGTDFPYDAFLPQAHTVQIDRDPTRLGRRTPLDLAVHGDVKATLRAVLPLLQKKPDRTFLDDLLDRHARALERVVDAYAHNVEQHRPIHPEYAARVLDELAADDAVFTVDTGMCNVWAARYLTPNGRRRVVGSFRHGTMANALPHAIGAQLALPDRQVISMSGDGGLSMLLGELITLRQHDLPVKVVVFNNGSLGMVKLEMLVAGLPEPAPSSPLWTSPPPPPPRASARGASSIRRTSATRSQRPWPTMVPSSWTSSQTPTPSRCRRTSPPPRCAGSPSPPPAPYSRVAWARCSTWRAPTSAISPALNRL